MILTCDFEELTALNASIGRVFDAAGAGGVAAPPQVIADIEALAPRLVGDLPVESLDELRSIERAVAYLLEHTKSRMDAFVLHEHPAAESAVLSYFEYAHLITFLDRTRRLAEEMAALIELMTGRPAGEDSKRRFLFSED